MSFTNSFENESKGATATKDIPTSLMSYDTGVFIRFESRFLAFSHLDLGVCCRSILEKNYFYPQMRGTPILPYIQSIALPVLRSLSDS
uniref:Uncharacterized protein n=1 Tax=Daphnia galeata TaxID=27404 RepID=A0A8J2W390_9CRUS|nr:unnamed protein product [Daphnia galeata]